MLETHETESIQNNAGTPIYKTPGDNCTFLGSWTGEDHRLADLYFYTSPPAVAAVYSSDAGDYEAGFELVGDSPAVTEAYKRALERGLLAERIDLVGLRGQWSAVFDEAPPDSSGAEELQDWARRYKNADEAFHAALDRLHQRSSGG